MRKEKLRNNASTANYVEAYQKIRNTHLTDLNGIDFNDYITGMSGALDLLSRVGRSPFKASPEQARVIYSTAKRIGVVASAGTGKTTTMLRKLNLNLIMFDWKASDVLAITYTNGAARNMQDNYLKILSQQRAEKPQVVAFKTIHKYGKEFIEIANPSLQLISETSPYIEKHYDEELGEMVETRIPMFSLIRSAMIANEVDPKIVQPSAINTALSVVSEKMIKSEDRFRASEQFMDFPISFDKLMQIKETYTLNKNTKGCMDYVDMLETIHLIVSSIESIDQLEDPRLRSHLTYKVIYLDEAQDVSPLQIDIINHLLRLNPDCQLVAIGDDDQSIFGFRGANPDYLVNLQDYYPMEDGVEPLEIIYMTENRRSAPMIVNTANKLIANNKDRHDKTAKAFNKNMEGRIRLVQDLESFQGKISTYQITERAKHLFETEHSARDMAILYREHSQMKGLLNEFIKERIPFNMGDRPADKYLTHKHFVVTDIIGIMRMINDLSNTYLLERYLYKLCPYMRNKEGQEIAEKFSKECKAKGKKLSQIIKETCYKGDEFNRIIFDVYKTLHDPKSDNYTLINKVYEYYKQAYLDWYITKNPEEVDEIDNAMDFLLNIPAQGYQGMRDYILETDNWVDTHYNYTLGVKFRTFHTSKGLEWDEVYLLPISNRVSPKQSVMEKMNEKDAHEYLEEERRLLYVACTRAIRDLTVYYEQDGPDDRNIFIEELKKAVAETELELEALKQQEEEQAPTEEQKSIIPMPELNLN